LIKDKRKKIPFRISLLTSDVLIKKLPSEDVDEAARIVRLAFGTYLKLDPSVAFGDKDVLTSRWRSDPSGVIGAYMDGRLIGSNVLTRWGSFGFFGPLTVHPDMWDKHVATQLMKATMELFAKWRIKQLGLFTFADSPKHIGLYQKFGFYPQNLTAILTKKVQAEEEEKGLDNNVEFKTFSSLNNKEEKSVLAECKYLANKVFAGLDLNSEIRGVKELKLGDTVLVKEHSKITAFAISHTGPSTEGGSKSLYVKFGLASRKKSFRHLIRAVEALAGARGVESIEAGMNFGRAESYNEMLANDFKSQFQGVLMQKPNQAGYNKPKVFAIDDLR
jgi:N-acetylglutamate synthase-like GNAT family acetyltransferase